MTLQAITPTDAHATSIEINEAKRNAPYGVDPEVIDRQYTTRMISGDSGPHLPKYVWSNASKGNFVIKAPKFQTVFKCKIHSSKKKVTVGIVNTADGRGSANMPRIKGLSFDIAQYRYKVKVYKRNGALWKTYTMTSKIKDGQHYCSGVIRDIPRGYKVKVIVGSVKVPSRYLWSCTNAKLSKTYSRTLQL